MDITECAIFEVAPERFELNKITVPAAKVTNISPHGFGLLLDDEELLVPFEEFPWFRSATVEQITAVERTTPSHLYWPQLDVDLSLLSIRNPERLPLVSRG